VDYCFCSFSSSSSFIPGVMQQKPTFMYHIRVWILHVSFLSRSVVPSSLSSSSAAV
jgi:hypothetical protein